MSDTAGESVAIERTENEIDKESGVNNVDDQDLGGNDSPELKSDITEKKGEDDDGKERHEDELGTEFDDSGCKQSRWRWFWASLVVAVLGGGLYSHPIMLHGELVYDDGSTIAKNPNVLGLVPWSQILKRDFWGGDQLIDPKSHKSFRPIVTATLRLNYMHAVYYWHGTMDQVETFGFHVTNVALHVLVSLACLPASFYAFGARSSSSFWPSLLTSILFAVIPIHSEAIENITGRAEPIMSLFYLLGFITYASSMMKHRGRDSIWPNLSQLFAIFFTVLFTVLSLLSKELGITLTMLCAYWDFFVVEELNLRNLLFVTDPSKRKKVLSWTIRTVLLGLSTVLVAIWRLSLNGGNPPFLRYNANRHGIEVDFATIAPELTHGGDTGVHGIYRWCSIAWLWVRYVQLCTFPVELSADWSGASIPLVRSLTDHRVAIMFILLLALASLIFVGGFSRSPWPSAMTAFGFFLFPFILSSNIFVVVGTTVAERVAYLPSLGICMAMALMFTYESSPSSSSSSSSNPNKVHKMGTFQLIVRSMLFVGVVLAYSGKCVERNFAWSNSATLWSEAFRVNPGSSHSIQNYAIHKLGDEDLNEVANAAKALNSIRTFDEVNRVDADEMYSPLVLSLRRLNRWQEALEAGAEAWERCNQREDAYKRGVKIWHMHELNPNVEKFALRRGRMLAGQATTLAHIDIKESATAALLAAELAPSDSVVMQMVQDLDRYAANSYARYPGADQGAPKPLPTQLYDNYRATWKRI